MLQIIFNIFHLIHIDFIGNEAIMSLVTVVSCNLMVVLQLIEIGSNSFCKCFWNKRNTIDR